MLAGLGCGLAGFLAFLIPEPGAKPYGDAYNKKTGQFYAIVVEVDQNHRFHGNAREGWLLRYPPDNWEMWMPRESLQSVELVRR